MRTILMVAMFGCASDGDTGGSTQDTGTTPQPTTIAYDDGSPEDYSSPWSNSPGGVLAVHFTLPEGATALLSASFWVHGTHFDEPFDVWLYDWDGDEPGDALHDEGLPATAAASDAWHEVDLSGVAVTLDEPEVVVGMEWLTAPGMEGQDAQWLGGDNTGPDQRSFWKGGMGGWASHEEVTGSDADLMIRLTVE
jgi:hypothetical protein